MRSGWHYRPIGRPGGCAIALSDTSFVRWRFDASTLPHDRRLERIADHVPPRGQKTGFCHISFRYRRFPLVIVIWSAFIAVHFSRFIDVSRQTQKKTT